MIWSVSTLLRRSGTPAPVCEVNASMSALLSGRCERLEVGGRRQRPAHRGRRGHGDRDQVGAPALALPALEVAVGGRRAALAGLEGVGGHAQAHRAARAPPLGAGLLEYHVETL